MQTGSIQYNGRKINRLGKPTVSISRRPDPEPPALATRQLYTITLSLDISKHSASGVHAVIRELDQIFAHGEGIFRMEDETGFSREWMANVNSSSPRDPLRGVGNHYEVELSSSQALQPSDTISHGATFLPTGGNIIHLHHMREHTETVQTDRHAERISARRLTVTNISFTARVFHADPLLTHAERMAQLQTVANQYRSLNCADGLLTYPGFTSLVHVQEIRPIIDERRQVLDIAVQCKRYDLPGEEKTEALLTRSTDTDRSTGEEVHSVSGTITSDDRANAMARLEAIRRSSLSANSRLTKFRHSMPTIIGGDTDYTEAWTGSIEFSMEYRVQTGACLGYELKISSEHDAATGSYRRSYSGYVTAPTLSAAEARARALGWEKHPYWTRFSEVSNEVNSEGPDGCTAMFLRLEFTYDYELVSDFATAEFTYSENKASYGDRSASISGSFASTDKTSADSFQQNVIRSLIPGASTATSLNLESRIINFVCTERNRFTSSAGSGGTVMMITRQIDFGVRVFTRGNTCHIKYNRSDRISYTDQTNASQASGIIWADSEALARSAYAALLAELNLGNITEERTAVDYERIAGENPNMVQFSFDVSGLDTIEGQVGKDIIEASWSLTRIGQVNHSIITEIPFRRPVAQQNSGWTVGQLRIQGSVKAATSIGARAWAQAKIPLIMSAGSSPYETAPPEETLSPTFLPASDKKISGWTFQFSYQRSYTSGLEGIWSGSLPSNS